jgi:hypothetical protein
MKEFDSFIGRDGEQIDDSMNGWDGPHPRASSPIERKMGSVSSRPGCFILLHAGLDQPFDEIDRKFSVQRKPKGRIGGLIFR